jgi:hypothetical protein
VDGKLRRQPVFGVRPGLVTPHTLINPSTEVVDHSAASSILAAGLGGYVTDERSADSGWTDRNTQNSFPSGSAMTTHGTSRWPM